VNTDIRQLYQHEHRYSVRPRSFACFCSCDAAFRTPNFVSLFCNHHANQSLYVNGQTACYCVAPLQIGVTSSSCLLRHCDVTQTRACTCPPSPCTSPNGAEGSSCIVCDSDKYGTLSAQGSDTSVLLFCLFTWQTAVFFCDAVLAEHVPAFPSPSSKTVPFPVYHSAVTPSTILQPNQLTAPLSTTYMNKRCTIALTLTAVSAVSTYLKA
jgi:hypothetical protein